MIKKNFSANIKINEDELRKSIFDGVYSQIRSNFSKIKKPVEDATRSAIIKNLRNHKVYKALKYKSPLTADLGLTQFVSDTFLASVESLISSRVKLEVQRGNQNTIAIFKLTLLEIKDNEIFDLPGASYISKNKKGEESLVEFAKWILQKGSQIILTDWFATEEGFSAKSRSNQGSIMIESAGRIFRIKPGYQGTDDKNLVIDSALDSIDEVVKILIRSLVKIFA